MKFIIEDSDIKELQRVSSDYFCIKLSDEASLKIIESSKGIKSELVYGGLGDTMARDSVIDGILEYLDITDYWPSNVCSDKYSEKFYKKLAEAVKEKEGVCFVHEAEDANN